ncbi:MAG: NADH-quinone oxidoreductase subunit L [Cytophagia bacterium]|nr:NADH-quinone oxidoreductase subunit L [Cytophagia bacterium]
MNEALLIKLLFLVLAMPLVSAMLAQLISEKYRWLTALLAVFILLLTTITTSSIFLMQWNKAPVMWEYNWFVLGDLTITAGLYINNVTLVMVFIVSFISLMVHLFSSGYMAGDKFEKSYYTMLGFFTFCMLGLVLANNLLLLFIFWELVGFSSYTLIGHWREKPLAVKAAGKAFVINRIADLGFIAAILILYTQTNSFGFTEIAQLSDEFWRNTAAICLLIAVMGKSAQVPFFNWLPSAMEGPTPVSALIHAATMVVAGIFLLIRMFPLFSPQVLDIIVIIGSTTALLGSLAALHQYDIKKILAYSTISQLGLMLAAVGTGAYGVALLHLFTHAFFKAGLFLGAGAIIHVLHQAQHSAHVHFDVQDIRNLGGLKKMMPVTLICFTVCSAALSGFPLLSGFQSKDAILVGLFNWSGSSWKLMFSWTVVLSSALTVIYSVRMLWYIFFAPAQKVSLLKVSEAPGVLRFPIVILSICSLWFVVAIHPLEYNGWLLNSIQPAQHDLLITWLSLILIPGLSLLALLWYRKREITSVYPVLKNGYYLDRIYETAGKNTALTLAYTAQKNDQWIDQIIHVLAYAQITFAHLLAWFDMWIIDGCVNGVAWMVRQTGALARSFSGGKIQTYIFWTTITLIIFLFWILF